MDAVVLSDSVAVNCCGSGCAFLNLDRVPASVKLIPAILLLIVDEWHLSMHHGILACVMQFTLLVSMVFGSR